MEPFIDTHCHILPETDDGARSIEETRRMLQRAYDENIRCIVATPHYHPKRGRKQPEQLRRQLELVRGEAEKISGSLKVCLGSEVYFGQDVPQELCDGKILTMNETRYVLMEFPPPADFEYICQGIQQVQMKGYEVILAHAERYEDLCGNVENAEHLAEMGALIQVNADSITGEGGRRAKRFVKKLMERELVFCVGTDAHHPDQRPPGMKKAARYVEKKYGAEYAEQIFSGNPGRMLRQKNREMEKNNV